MAADAATPREVRTIAVIGAGSMGRDIAYQAALAGYRTLLEDIVPANLRRAENEIRAGLDKAVGLGAIEKSAASDAIGRIEYASTIEDAVRQADIVIEAVPDELESKLEIFSLLDRMCLPNTILVSTTSLLNISDICSVTYRRNRCVGMRFVDPIREMKQVEIVRAAETDDETVVAMDEVLKRMGIETVVIRDVAILPSDRLSC